MRLLFVLLSFFTSVAIAQNVKTYIPPQAFEHRETIRSELDRYFSEIPDYNYVPALIEHESCLSLRHSKCWNSKSELKTSRERGVGLGQVTVAYREDGSVRFDTLTNLKNLHKQDLKEASWSTIKNRPDIQIRMIVLLLKGDHKKLYNVPDSTNRLHMTDSAYNGGVGDVLKSRRACGMAKGCNPNVWFDNVETYNVKSNRILYGNRSAKMINNYHVRDVFFTRLPKYKLQYFKE